MCITLQLMLSVIIFCSLTIFIWEMQRYRNNMVTIPDVYSMISLSPHQQSNNPPFHTFNYVPILFIHIYRLCR